MVAFVSGIGIGLNNSSAQVLGANGRFGTVSHGQTKENALVNLANGNLILQGRDDFLAAVGNADLELTRTYNSQGGFDEKAGRNWKLGAYKRITTLRGPVYSAGSSVVRVDGDGTASTFQFDVSRNQYVSTDGGGAYQFLQIANNQWVYSSERSDLRGWSEAYEGATGRLVALRRDGVDYQKLSYDAQSRLYQISNLSGDTTTYQYDAGNGLLQSVSHQLTAGGGNKSRVSYQYDAQARLNQVSIDLTPDDKSDSQFYKTVYTYDGDSERIASVAQDDGSKLSFIYLQHNGAWKVASFSNGLGQITSLSYEAGRTIVTDALNAKTIYSYDASGQLTAVEEPAVGGVVQKMQFFYDAKGNLSRSVDARGLETVAEYDANGNRVLERDALGNTVTRNYDQTTNLLLTETRYQTPDADGAGSQTAAQPLSTHYAYDGMGNLRFVVSPEGRVTEYRYNGLGQRTSSLEYQNSYNKQFWLQNFDANSDGIVQNPLPAGFARQNGKLVVTSTQAASVTHPSIHGSDKSLGTNWKVEVTTPAVSSQGLLSVGVDSGAWNTPDGRRLRVIFNANNKIDAQLQNGLQASYPAVGESKPNTTYVVEVVTDTSGKATLYVYEKNKARNTGYSISQQFIQWTPLRFAALTTNAPDAAGGVAGASNSIVLDNLSTERNVNEIEMMAWVRSAQVDKSRLSRTDYHYDVRGNLSASSKYDSTNDLGGTGGVDYEVQNETAGLSMPPEVKLENDALIFTSTNQIKETSNGATGIWRKGGSSWRFEVKTPATPSKGLLTAGIASGTWGQADNKRLRAYFHDDGIRLELGQGPNITYPWLGAVKNNTDYVVEIATQESGLATIYIYEKGLARSSGVSHTVQFEAGSSYFILANNWCGPAAANRSVPGSTNQIQLRNLISYPSQFLATGKVRPVFDQNGQAVFQVDASGKVLDVTDEIAAMKLPPEASLVNGSVVFTSTNQSTITINGATGLWHKSGYTWQAEVNTPEQLTPLMLDVGIASGTGGQADNKRLRAFFDKNVLRVQVGTGTNFSYPALGQVKPKTTYITEIVTTESGLATIYVYEKGSSRSNGVSHAVQFDASSSYYLLADTYSGPLAATEGVPGSTNKISLSNVLTYLSRPEQAAVTRYVYDHAGQLLSSIDASGKQTSYTWDGLGRTLSSTDALGNQTVSVYENGGAKVRLIQANGLQKQLSYDQAGNLLLLQESKDGANLGTSRNVYDAAGRLRRTELHNAQNLWYIYDAAGRRTGEVDANNYLTEYFYNNNDQVVLVKRYGTVVSTASLVDANGNLREVDITSLRPVGGEVRSTWNVYDNSGRLLQTIAANGAVKDYVYDGLSRLVETIEYETRYDIKLLGAQTTPPKVSVATALGDRRNLYLYDKDGNQVGLVDGDNYLTEKLYDWGGRLSDVIRYANVSTAASNAAMRAAGQISQLRPATNSLDQRERFYYNGKNQLIGSLDAEGYLTEMAYDANGKVTSQLRHANPAKNPVNSGTIAGLQVTPHADDQQTLYTYSARGELLAESLADGSVNLYSYDALGQQVAVQKTSGKLVLGNDAANSLSGSSGNDVFVGRAGNDSFDGVSGKDTAIYAGKFVDYRFTYSGGVLTVYDRNIANGDEGTDTLRNVKVLRFADRDVTLVDGLSYIAGYADLIRAYGSNADAGVQHYLQMGINEGRVVSFNGADYLARYADVRAAYGNDVRAATLHFINHGFNEGRDKRVVLRGAFADYRFTVSGLNVTIANNKLSNGDPASQTVYAPGILQFTDRDVAMVDGLRYIASYADLTQGYRNNADGGVQHYLQHGVKEGRIVSFNAADYLAKYTDLKALYGNDTYAALQHYLTQGYYQGRNDNVALQASDSVVEERAGFARYDSQGRLVAELSGEGAAKWQNAVHAPPLERERIWVLYANQYRYNQYGQRSASIDANGNRSLYYYDAAGRLSHTINALGEIAEVSYNAFGEQVATRQYTNRLSGSQLAGLQGGTMTVGLSSLFTSVQSAADARTSTSYEHTAQQSLRDETDAQGFHTRDRFDVFGAKLESARQSSNNTGRYITDTLSYDKRGNLIKVTPFTNNSTTVLTVSKIVDAFGRVESEKDANGNQRSYEYDDLNRVTRRLDGNGRAEKIEYDAFGRIISTTDRMAAVTGYSYDLKKRTATITSAAGVVHTSQQNRFGETVKIHVGEADETTYRYDKNGRLLSVSDALGVQKEQDYDRAGNLIREVDANGVVTRFEYDVVNRLVKTTFDPQGLNLSSSYTYDAMGRKLTETDARGVVTETQYLNQGQEKVITRDKGGVNQQVLRYKNDSRGNLDYAWDHQGRWDRFWHDDFSRARVEVKDHGGAHVGVYTATDAGGNVILRATGSDAVNTNTYKAAARYAYNANNQLIYELDADNGVSHYVYDLEGRLVKTTHYVKRSNLINASTNWRDVFSAEQIKNSVSADANDAVTRTVYDADGRVYATIDAAGAVTVNLAFDANGRVTESVSYAKALNTASLADVIKLDDFKTLLGNANLSDVAHDKRQLTQYDVRGRMLWSAQMLTKDANGSAHWKVAQQSYDANGNVIARTEFARTLMKAAPTAADINAFINNPASRAPQDLSLRMVYDKANRLLATARQVALGADGQYLWNVSAQGYDMGGNVTYRRSYVRHLQALHASTSEIQSFVVDVSKQSGNDQHQRYTYDSLGRLSLSATVLEVVDGVSNWALEKRTYDTNGNLLSHTAYASTLAHNATGTNAADANFNAWIAGGIKTDAKDRVTRYAYDGANRLVYTQDANNALRKNVYDVFGNVVQQIAYAIKIGVELHAGYVATSSSADQTTRMVYDQDRRLRYQIDSSGAVSETVYDAIGRATAVNRYARAINVASVNAGSREADVAALINRDSNDRSQRYVYDAGGRVSYTINAEGHVQRMVYDALGRVRENWAYAQGVGKQAPGAVADLRSALAALVANANANNRRTQTDYDAQGDVLSVTDAEGKTERYTWDALQRKTSITDKQNRVTTYAYNGLNKVEAISYPTVDGTSNLRETFHYDGLGNKTGFTDRKGQLWSYEYDAGGRLRAENSPFTNLHQLSVQDSNGVLAIGSQTSVVSLRTEYNYDAHGNLSRRSEAVGRSNSRSTRFEYDAIGQQIKTVFEKVKVYERTADVRVLERRELEKDVTIEVAYDAFGNAISSKDQAGVVRYKAYDQQNRVRYAVDGDGYVTGHDYNAFGEEAQLTRYAQVSSVSGIGRSDLTQLTTWANQANRDRANDRSLRKEYDLAGRVARVIEPLSFTFDANRADGSDPYAQLRKTTENSYDSFGGVSRKQVYGLDQAGQRVGTTQENWYAYDKMGRLVKQIDIASNSNGQLQGYLSSQSYDAVGNLTRKVEYANRLNLVAGDMLNTTKWVSAWNQKDRDVEMVYDNLNRKTDEIVHNTEYIRAGQTAPELGNLKTSYAYDALNQQVSVTDALGNVSYQYYDALGRVTAVAASRKKIDGSTVTALSELKLDEYGNTVLRTEYANSATAVSAADYQISTHFDDRSTGTEFERWGRALREVDAERQQSFSSYDEMGRIAKQWRSVSVGAGKQTVFTLSQYDQRGNLTSTTSVDSQSRDAANVLLAVRGMAYNAFGEVTEKTIQDKDRLQPAVYAYFDYDNSGQAWRVQDESGVVKINLYDVHGNQTAQLLSTETDTVGLSRSSNVYSAQSAVQAANVQKTISRYNLLGQQIQMAKENETQVEVLRQEENGTWSKFGINSTVVPLDTQFVVGSSQEKEGEILVYYRRLPDGQKAGTDWLNGNDRMVRQGVYLAFNSAGLATGNYEYRVMLKNPAGEWAERELVRVSLESNDGALKVRKILQLYASLLLRTPRASELNYWLERANDGVPMGKIARDFYHSDEAKTALGTDLSARIRAIWAKAYGRTGEVDDAQYGQDMQRWQDSLSNLSDEALGAAFSNLLDEVSVYKGADNYWLSSKARMERQVEAGRVYANQWQGMDIEVSRQVFAMASVNLADAVSYAGGKGLKEKQDNQISALYVTLLNRSVEKAGLAHWRAALDSNARTMVQVATDILSSAEAIGQGLYPAKDSAGNVYTATQRNANLIGQLYQSLLGRGAGAEEIAYWQGEIAKQGVDGVGAFVLQMVSNVATYRDGDNSVYPYKNILNNRTAVGLAFAANGYAGADVAVVARALNRAVAGESKIEDAVTQAKLRLAQLKVDAQQGRDAATSAAQVQKLQDARMSTARLYIGLLGRVPDKGGLEMWADVTLKQGAAASAQQIMTSPEAAPMRALSNDAFISTIYDRLLDRQPDASGRKFWADQLAGGANRGTVAVAVIDALLEWQHHGKAEMAAVNLLNSRAAVGLVYAQDVGGDNLAEAKEVLLRVKSGGLHAGINYVVGLASSYASRTAGELSTALNALNQPNADIAVAVNNMLTVQAQLKALSSTVADGNAQMLEKTARLYVAILKRGQSGYAGLDWGGLAFFVQSQRRGLSEASIAQGLFESAEGRALYPVPADPAQFDRTGFVKQMFINVLGRSAGQGDLDYWVPKMGGVHQRGSFVLALFHAFLENPLAVTDPGQKAQELTLRAGFLQKVYGALSQVSTGSAGSAAASFNTLLNQSAQADTSFQSALNGLSASSHDVMGLYSLMVGILKRGPGGYAIDAPGISFWLTQLQRNGASLSSIAQSMIDSGEGQGIYSGKSHREFVSILYRQILGRELAASETFWESQLNNGARRGDVALNIINAVLNGSWVHVGENTNRAAFFAKLEAASLGVVSAMTSYNSQMTANRDAAASNYVAAATATSNAYNSLQAAQTNKNYAATVTAYGAWAGFSEMLAAAWGTTSIDLSTLASMMSALSAGASQVQMIAGIVGTIADSASAAERQSYLSGLYSQILRRSPDSGGLQWWVSLPTKGAQLTYDFVQSALSELKGSLSKWPGFSSGVSALQAQVGNALSVWQTANTTYTQAQQAEQNANGVYNAAYLDWQNAHALQVANAAFSNGLYDKGEQADLSRAQMIGGGLNVAPLARTDNMANFKDDVAAAASLIGVLASTTSLADVKAKVASSDAAYNDAVSRLSKVNADSKTKLKIIQLYQMLYGRPPSLSELASCIMVVGVKASQNPDETVALKGWLQEELDSAAFAAQNNDSLLVNTFKHAFGRDFSADAAGKTFWSNNIQTTGRAQFLLDLLRSVTEMNTTTDAATFIGRTATALQSLKPAVDAEQANPNVSNYITMRSSRADLLAAQANKLEAAALESSVVRHARDLARVYILVLNRTPDAEGFAGWLAALQKGSLSLKQMVTDIFKGIEVQQRYPVTQSASDFTQALYANLGRSASADELQAGINLINSNGGNNENGRGALILHLISKWSSAGVGTDSVQRASSSMLGNRLDMALGQVGSKLQTLASERDKAVQVVSGITGVEAKYLRVQLISWESQAKSTLRFAGTRMERDRWGNVVTISDPRNPHWKTSYTYNAGNQQMTTSKTRDDGGQDVSGIGYDALGREVTRLDGNKNLNQIVYDGVDVIEKHADSGQVINRYNLFGNKISVSLSRDHSISTEYAYDHLGRMISSGSNAQSEVWIQYDQFNSYLPSDMVPLPDGVKKMAAERYTYDELGRQVGRLDASGKATLMRYDSEGNLIQTDFVKVDVDLMNGQAASDALKAQVKRDGVTSLAGNSRANFDMFKHKIWSEDGNKNKMIWSYNERGQLQYTADMSDKKTYYSYDQAGQLLRQTSEWGQNIVQTWDNGQLVKIEDKSLGQVTRYSYDMAGNRTQERIDYIGTDSNVPKVLQNNQIEFDAQNRMKRIKSERSDIVYTYDGAGNRETMSMAGVTYHNRYDSMNRQTWVNAIKDAAGNLTYGQHGHYLTYDTDGNRTSDSYTGKRLDLATGMVQENGITKEVYIYDIRNRLFTTQRDGLHIEHRRYDAAGRVVEAGFVGGSNQGMSDDTVKSLARKLGLNPEKRTYSYEDNGALRRQRSLELGKGPKDALFTEFMQKKGDQWQSGYDQAGNLTNYYQAGGGSQRYEYSTGYLARESYKEISQTKADHSTSSEYDVNGNRILVRNHDGSMRTRLWYDGNGKILAKKADNKLSYNLVVNNEMLGVEDGTDLPGTTYDHVGTGSVGDAPSSYSVQNNGETLRSVAKGLWGDASLWYVIADANGLNGGESLAAGQILRIPAKPSTLHNDSTTFKPYNASELIGDTMPVVPPPSQGGGCGGLAQIFMILVAVVVTIYTAGAMTSSVVGFGNVMSAGVGAISGGLTATTAFVAGAAGSLASQVAGNVMGVQSGISWKAVAMAGVSGAIGAGVSKALGPMMAAMNYSQTAIAVTTAIVSNVATQTVFMAAGAQEKFSWRSVAAAGVTSYLGSEMGKGKDFVGHFGRNMVTGVASSLITKGRVDWGDVVRDSFGNALGSSLVAGVAQQRRAENSPRNASNALADIDLGQAQKNLNESLYAIEGPSFDGPRKPADACFVGGTMVHSKNGLVPIETIGVGELVAARHQANAQAPIQWRRVMETYQFGEKSILQLLVQYADNSQESISATHEHPFFVNGEKWTRAENLVIGNKFELIDGGQAVLVGKTSMKGTHTVFNFAVEEDHTYFVGEKGVWVHNRSYEEFLADIKARTSTTVEYLGLLKDQAFDKANEYIANIRENNPSLAKGISIVAESLPDMIDAAKKDMVDAAPGVAVDVALALAGVFLAPESFGGSLALSATRILNRLDKTYRYGNDIVDAMSAAEKYKDKLAPETMKDVLKSASNFKAEALKEFAGEETGGILPGLENEKIRNLAGQFLNEGAKSVAWFSDLLSNSKNKIGKISGVMFGMTMKYFDVAEKITQTFFDNSGLFKDRDNNGNQQSGPLQNRSNQGLDYAGMPSTGKYDLLKKFLVFDVKSSWNGKAAGMTEGANSMARRVIRSAEQTWNVSDDVKNYARYMRTTQGSTKFDGYLVQFDHLGDKSYKNHVRISDWKN